MSTRVVIVSAALFLSVLPGCNGPSQPKTTGAGVKETVDGVSYEVRGEGSSSAFVGDGYRELTVGATKLRIQGDRFSVNGKEYGPVKSGDTVLLDADGTLTINGERR